MILRVSRLMELFEAAVELEPHARATFLDRACPGDPQLRERVEALLQTDAEADPSFLDAPPVDAGLVETVLKGAPAGEAPVQIGETLGVYTIEGLLGHGSMGWVYRARHSVLGRDVALKVLGAELTRDPELVARFFAEAKVVNAIRHPNIIDVTDFIDELEPRRVGYVMTLLGGASLDNVLRERRLTLPQVVNIAWQLLDTLEAVHAGDVVHRDLKPENVFVTGDLATDLSAVPSVVVLDFGVAKIAERSGYRTATGAVVGTPRYMAPEQVQGTEVGPASDLYAWALIVVEMWTGEPVFRGSVPGILQAKLSAQAAPLPTLEVKPGLEPLVRVLQQCLAPLPSLRPESAEIRHALLPLMRRGAKITRTTVAVLDETEMALTPWREEAARLGGEALSEDEGGLTVAFEDPNTALHFATLVTEARERAQIGVDTASDVGQGHSTAQALARAAAPGGVLVGSITAHSARTEGLTGSAGSLAWTSHGIVSVDGLRHPVEVFELGEGVTSKTELRQVAADPTLRGWRPSPGLIVPGRAPWRLMRALASGGFGEVWVAEDAEGRQRVFKFAFEERAARSLEREARLHHWLAQDLGQRTDILSVLNLHDGSPPHLETELIPGGDLSRWLDRQGGAGRVPIDQRIELVAQAAEALAEVHAVGVLHRDIKPGNLLVREPPQVVLADFGIGGMAEPTPAAEGEAGERAPDSVQLAGTLLYMAPERLAGRPASVQADLYALGVVLFQLVVEDLTRPVGPGWRDAVLDPVLREDLGQLLEEDPRQRTADAGSVARNLRSLEERRAARAQAEADAAAAARARRFRRVFMPVVAALVLVIAIVSLQAWRIQQEATRAQREADRANREASTAAETVDFLVGLFEVADPSAEPPTVREVLDRGAAQLRTELAEEPVVKARLMSTVGQVYANLGMFEPAKSLSSEALSLRSRALGATHPDVAASLQQLGGLETALSRFSEAEGRLRRALEIRRANFGADHPATAETLNDIAQLAFLRGEAERAEQLYLQALAVREAALGPEDLAVAETANHLGWLYAQRNRFEEAETFLSRALDIRVANLGEKHFSVARTLFVLADVYLFQGRLVEAETTILRTLDIQRQVLGSEHGDVGVTLVTLGALRRQQGRLEASDGHFGEAIQILSAVHGPDNLDVGQVHYERSRTLEQAGRLEAASSSLEKALPIYEAAYGPSHPAVGRVLNNLGSILGEGLGHRSEAIPLIRRSLDIFDAGTPPDRYWQGLSRWTLANLLRDEGQTDEARTVYSRAVELLEAAEPGRADERDLSALRADFARLESPEETQSGRLQ